MKTSNALITLLSFFTAGALALPTAQQATEGPAKPNVNAVQVNYGTPRCPDPRLDALCMASNANAYCDAQGFHNNFMKTCKACYCEQ
ncbi:hypothetical protein NEUTE1DRAFT_79315 [Neurospora tetrasperma FGSC 2508]|uniref:ShKT domain-containing protein n=1 Tax=Neurospora tetrasperma (strain FGSC 2508 / ATCC MYA-4615 / P0657) TaxID=510951 RepID=F8MFV4_NEUT8|nr:uncharacterized protein NEUTE1DRAFT_79315 [Neurospora tetrasperma FGSC 2508]EGO59330.1 hypothetical protein NEUTE1DRAFT_79315 [Neurospora tetrasperma FGSC 2508]EGZ73450.1 hypothetical protein NEUTE2DRAFT_156923 [Neurospora tetrasperma FGSC 2509]